jgi:hypothetical protein
MTIKNADSEALMKLSILYKEEKALVHSRNQAARELMELSHNFQQAKDQYVQTIDHLRGPNLVSALHVIAGPLSPESPLLMATSIKAQEALQTPEYAKLMLSYQQAHEMLVRHVHEKHKLSISIASALMMYRSAIMAVSPTVFDLTASNDWSKRIQNILASTIEPTCSAALHKVDVPDQRSCVLYVQHLEGRFRVSI